MKKALFIVLALTSKSLLAAPAITSIKIQQASAAEPIRATFMAEGQLIDEVNCASHSMLAIDVSELTCETAPFALGLYQEGASVILKGHLITTPGTQAVFCQAEGDTTLANYSCKVSASLVPVFIPSDK